MDERAKISHVLRRFGLGAGRYELRRYAPLGLDGTIDALLGDDRNDDGFRVNPFSRLVQEDGKIDGGAYHLAGWWALRMLATLRPFEQKLMLFWHDHFSVDAEKVAEAPTMLGYLEVLRQQGRGKFRDLLHGVCKQGAMVIYLDNATSSRLKPNENFAREVFELFTMGEGTYSEKDVQEAARAFTGWSVHYLGILTDAPYETLSQSAYKSQLSMLNFAFVPGIHDDGEKTILGRKDRWNGDMVLDALAKRPETARYICTKLWTWFAGHSPSDQVLGRLTQTWDRTDGDVREVCRAIAKSAEFYSESVVRQMPKSPVDYTVALFRALDLGDLFRTMQNEEGDPRRAVKKELKEAGDGIHYLMAQQGLGLLFPPNVGGWEWGKPWLTTANTMFRIKHGDVIFWTGGDDRPMAAWLANKIKTDGNPQTAAEIVDAFVDTFDVPCDAAQRDALIERCTQAGGPKALEDKDATASLFSALGTIAFAIPEFQLC